jgi:phosphate transport system substrate-binding protein
MRDLARRFMEIHPGAAVTVTPGAPPTAPAGLAAGSIDIGFTGRSLRSGERAAIVASRGEPPLSFEFALGAYADGEATETMAVVVHQDNPLRSLNLAQLRGILSSAEISRWDQVLADPAWRDRPIRPLVGRLGTGATDFVRGTVPGFAAWHPGVREFATDREVVQALGRDAHALAVVGLSAVRPPARAVGIAGDSGEPHLPTREKVAALAYPLTRRLFLHFNQTVSDAAQDRLRWEFFRFALSAEGQALVAKSRYLPLPSEVARGQLQRLGSR